jgi:hypothetical protein
MRALGMGDPNRHLAQEREEIATRIASFRATQERFKREREEFFAITWNASAQPGLCSSGRDGPPNGVGELGKGETQDRPPVGIGKNDTFYKNNPAS